MNPQQNKPAAAAAKNFVENVNAFSEAVTEVMIYSQETLAAIEENDLKKDVAECTEKLRHLRSLADTVMEAVHAFFFNADIEQGKVKSIKDSYRNGEH